MDDDVWAFIDRVGTAWERSNFRNGQQPVYRVRWNQDDAFFEYATPGGRRNNTHYHIFWRHGHCRYQLTNEGRHNPVANVNVDTIFEGRFNGDTYNVREWVNFFADGLNQCMNGELNGYFTGGGKKSKRSLKNRSKRLATHRKKTHATKRRWHNS